MTTISWFAQTLTSYGSLTAADDESILRSFAVKKGTTFE